MTDASQLNPVEKKDDNTNWDIYNDMLFAVTRNEKIVGTFFSETTFGFESADKITGSGIVYKKTNTDENDYVDDSNDFSNIQFLFHVNRVSDDIIAIYKNNVLTGVDDAATEITCNYTKINYNSIEAKELKSNNQYQDVTNKIDDIIKKLRTNISTLKSGDQKGGAAQYIGNSDIRKIQDMVTSFSEFVNIFTSNPIIFKLNSLKSDQINEFFNKLKSFKIVEKNENQTDVNIYEITSRISYIKTSLFDKLFYNFNVNSDNHSFDNVNVASAMNKLFDPENYTKDTANGNTIFGTGKKYIYIQNVANYIEKQFVDVLKSEMVTNLHITNDFVYCVTLIIENIITMYEKQISLDVNGMEKSYDIQYILGQLNQVHNYENFAKPLNEYINKNVSDKIVTFVKITNFNDNTKVWNQRFNVLLNKMKSEKGRFMSTKETNTLVVEYNDDNKKYYNGANLIDSKSNPLPGKNEYLFGNFTQIFTPNMTNKMIAEQMDTVISKVKEGKPVFIIGYGASGAGKTSSLIYKKNTSTGSNNNSENGVIISICDKLLETDFDTIEVETYEFFNINSTENVCEGKNTLEEPFVCSSKTDKTLVFKKNGKNIVLQDDYPYTPKHTYRFDEVNRFRDPNIQNTEKKTNETNEPVTFKKDMELGQALIYLIDTDRLVKATTNNPQSSRSHNLMFLKFRQSEKSGYLIVGDFAGVENKFTCDNIGTRMNLLNVKDNGKLFYQVGSPDTFYGGEITANSINFTTSKTNSEYKSALTFKPQIRSYLPEDIDIISDENNILLDVEKIKLLNDINISTIITEISDLTNDAKLKEAITSLKATIGNLEPNISKKYIRSSFNQIPNANSETKSIHPYFTHPHFIKVTFNRENAIIGKRKIKGEQKEGEYTIQEPAKSPPIIMYKNDRDKVEMDIYCGVSTDDPGNNLFSLNNQLTHFINTKFTPTLKSNTDISNIYIYIYFTIIREVIYNSGNNSRFDRNKVTNLFKTINQNSNKYFHENLVYKIENNTHVFVMESQPFYKQFKDCIVPTSILSKDKDLKKYKDAYFRNERYTNYIASHDVLKNARDALVLNTKVRGKPENFRGKAKLVDIYLNSKENISLEKTPVSKALTYVKTLIDALNTNLEFGKTICKNRVKEGQYINNSLEQIRNTINDILIVKSEDVIYTSPDYVNLCLKAYCPTNRNCFAPKNTDINETIKSGIFTKIFEYLKEQTYFEGKSDPEYQKQFYKDILITMFCVFNISTVANDPPPVPYIDINELKYYVSLYEENPTENPIYKKLGYCIIELLIKLELNNNKDISSYTNDQLVAIKSSNEYTEIVEIYKEIGNEEDDDQDQDGEKSDKSISTSVPESPIFDKFPDLRNDSGQHAGKLADIPIIATLTKGEELTDYIEQIKELIGIIDKSNSTSAIGTLEFMDSASKFNTVSLLCSNNNDDIKDDFNKFMSTTAYDMKDIYSSK